MTGATAGQRSCRSPIDTPHTTRLLGVSGVSSVPPPESDWQCTISAKLIRAAYARTTDNAEQGRARLRRRSAYPGLRRDSTSRIRVW